jgi:hypothetical protein
MGSRIRDPEHRAESQLQVLSPFAGSVSSHVKLR